MKINKVLARLGDKVDPQLSELITTMLSQPLMVAPHMIDGYVKDALVNGAMGHKSETSGEYSGVPLTMYPEIKTAVIDISGGLTARKMSVPCARSPASYEQIKLAMIKQIDNGVEFIVGRFNSGGGAASQMADLSRWIKSQRPNVRLIACVDDYAYSAAFGLATAFDTVYVTETSGAGSVGVVIRTENNVPTDGDVTYIYAGDKKINGAMDLPLTEETINEYQAEVDRLYGLFTELVSDNLDIKLENVVATQAGTYHGQGIIDVGFAHKIGNFETVINMIYEGVEMTQDEIKDAQARVDVQEAKLAKAKQVIAAAQAENDAIAVAEAASDEGSTNELENKVAALATIDADKADALKIAKEVAKAELLEAAKAETARVAEITQLCASAGVSDVVLDTFIAKKFTADETSKILIDMSSNDGGGVASVKPIPQNSVDDQNAIRDSWKAAFAATKIG